MSFEIPVNFTYLQEPVDIWRKSGSLDLLYRKKITSSLFQMMVLATRSTSLFSTVSQLKKNRLNIIFTERSLKFGDRAFSNLYVTDQNELKMYNDCAQSISSSFDNTLKGFDPNFEEIYMYLNLDANECLERIKQRRRSEEDNVSLDLLQNIQNSHEEMMKIINTIHIDANKHQAEIVENILEKIYICD
tara:strand:+ start:256 stop:822 length:567 start_codon:yes stop_codon:yes gene_type:complete